MILRNPYTKASGVGLLPYTAKQNFDKKDTQRSFATEIYNSVSKNKEYNIPFLKSLWGSSFSRKPPFTSPVEEVIPNAMICIDDIKVWEFWGQRNALNRKESLIRLAKNFDYRQFEPLKVAQIEEDGVTSYYCYDGGGRLHILYACGFKEVPCFVVKLDGKADLQRLFLDQKKYVSTINTETMYIQDLALIEHMQNEYPDTWYEEVGSKQKYSYNLAKLLDFCSIPINADKVTATGMLSKGYSVFCSNNTGKKPTEKGTVQKEAHQLADSLNLWTSLLSQYFPNEKEYRGSVVLYTGATLWRLSQIKSKDTDLQYQYLKNNLREAFEDSIREFKNKNPIGSLNEYYDYLLKQDIEGGLTGASKWGQRDKKLMDTVIFSVYFAKRNSKAVKHIFSHGIETIK
jgi:hypothetical protein